MKHPALAVPAALALLALGVLLGCSAALPDPQAPAPDSPTLPPPSATAGGEAAAATDVDRFASDAVIPVDPDVTIGKLDNGLTYYVRANGKPENRASLRLVVNAGSIVEDEDQRGLAHFVEHMAFNGTHNFAKQELVDYLEKIGMRFGADVNAFTSFDETVYMLEVPTDDDEIFATAFQILEDWAHRVSFDGEEIDKERGVVVEEWRLGRGANSRIRDRQFPVIFHGSLYAERLPIGEREILEKAPHDSFRSFYRDWYRPDLMAVVAVGDFDETDTIGRIEEHFGRIPMPEEPRPRTESPVPGHDETLTSIVTDEEATAVRVTVGYKRPLQKTRSVGDARRDLIDNLYDAMMNARLSELAKEADPPYQYGFAGSGPLGRTKAMYSISAGVRDGGVDRGLTTLLTEAKRVAEHGFSASELERAKTNMLRGIERLWEERDKQESARYVGGYSRHFLDQAPIPSIDFVRDLYTRLMPGIELAEVNARAGQWITDTNRIILLSGPDTDEAGIPREAELLGLFAAAEKLDVTPWVDRTRDEPLVERQPEPGSIVSEEAIAEIGATLWQLSNGAQLLLKPTDFKNDEVLIRGYSPGGHSLVPEQDYISAIQATAVAAEMGLGNFDSIELGKALTGKVAGVNAFVGEISEGISGRASPRDLETLFQLIYLKFTGARRDERAFKSYLSTARGNLENQEASPSFWFNKKWNEVTFKGHPRRRLFTIETYDEVNLDRALEIYNDRFADASDFVFTMVGSFELDVVRPLVETWLASLPAIHRNETFRDVEAYAEPGVSEFEVRKGIEPKSNVRIVFHGFADWSPLQAHIASSMADALRIRLREVMREDLGGVYGVRVYSSLRRYPKGRYNSGISFTCDPDRTEELLSAAFAELDSLRTEGPTQATVDKVREIQRRSRETALERNGFWLGALHLQQINDLPLTEILEYDRKIEAVTRDSVREAARRYFDSTSYILGVLNSEEAATD
ncbi:MAG: insulinase family protein [bacterium]|nr:insulinase family protein [bacterium]